MKTIKEVFEDHFSTLPPLELGPDPLAGSRHTPGPWEVGALYGHLRSEIAAAEGRVIVASAFTRRWDNREDAGYRATVPDAEGAANACLIAAAPLLLAELEDVSTTLKRIVAAVNKMPRKYAAAIYATMPRGYGPADAAIALARGKS